MQILSAKLKLLLVPQFNFRRFPTISQFEMILRPLTPLQGMVSRTYCYATVCESILYIIGSVLFSSDV